MIRESAQKHLGLDPDFRYRGSEPGRLENFSDALFALAITLLLISTSPPTNFEQIKRFLFDLIPFVMCIVLILLIWYQHFIFFYRYGLRNPAIVAFNTLFLIIVLFYVYPLKFLMKLSLFPIARLFEISWLMEDLNKMIHFRDMADLMIIYGLGASAVFFTLALMYRYIHRHHELIDLNEIEKFDTRTSVRTNIFMGSIPLFSVLVAVIFHDQNLAGAYAGMSYFLYFPVMIIHGKREDRLRKELLRTNFGRFASENDTSSSNASSEQ